jgi:bis(5'-nucleosidyl)-tetraphosphatase
MIKEISYGIVPFRGDQILLLRCYDLWDFPKGKPEDGETGIATALRELFEETTLIPNIVYDSEYIETEPYKQNKKVARYYPALADSGECKLVPNPATGIVEHHGFKWVTPDQAEQCVPGRLKPVIKWAVERIKNGIETKRS